MAPGLLGERDWNVWYARAVVAAGNVALIQLTVRLAVDPTTAPSAGEPVGRWGPGEFSMIEQRARALAARKIAATRYAGGSPDPRLDAPEDTVIRVGLVNMPDLSPATATATALWPDRAPGSSSTP